MHKSLQNCRMRSSNAEDPPESDLIAAGVVREKEGMAKFRQIAGWLEHDYPDAARSLLEGLEECFTINRLDVRYHHACPLWAAIHWLYNCSDFYSCSDL